MPPGNTAISAKTNQPDLRIGLYGSAALDIVERPLGGVLEYVRQHQGVQLIDSRTAGVVFDVKRDDPPWTGRVDGAIISFGFRGDGDVGGDVLRWIGRGGVPVVSVFGDLMLPALPCVITSPRSIAQLAADQLVAMDCRRFVYLGYAGSVGSKLRGEAFNHALADRGYTAEHYDFTDVPREGVVQALEQDRKALAEMLQDADQRVGILALGDPYARVACQICEDMRLRVPEDVAVVGVNNLLTSQILQPTITSIAYPGEQVGYEATDVLVQMMRGGPKPAGVRLVEATELFPRESTTGQVDMPTRIAMAVKIIEHEACKGLTTDALASTLGVSRRTIELDFKNVLGRSPRQEIARVRMLRARMLLEETAVSVEQIGYILGFSEKSAMYRFFKQHTGMTAEEYRRVATKE